MKYVVHFKKTPEVILKRGNIELDNFDFDKVIFLMFLLLVLLPLLFFNLNCIMLGSRKLITSFTGW